MEKMDEQVIEMIETVHIEICQGGVEFIQRVPEADDRCWHRIGSNRYGAVHR